MSLLRGPKEGQIGGIRETMLCLVLTDSILLDMNHEPTWMWNVVSIRLCHQIKGSKSAMSN
jgi:hypothetical protein